MAKEFAKTFYNSKEWIKCKNAYIKSKLGLCERCSKVGTIVHHKKYINKGNINDPNITLNFNNLELLCHDCHNKEHMIKHSAIRDNLMFDSEGRLVKK